MEKGTFICSNSAAKLSFEISGVSAVNFCSGSAYKIFGRFLARCARNDDGAWDDNGARNDASLSHEFNFQSRFGLRHSVEKRKKDWQ